MKCWKSDIRAVIGSNPERCDFRLFRVFEPVGTKFQPTLDFDTSGVRKHSDLLDLLKSYGTADRHLEYTAQPERAYFAGT